MFLIKDQDEFLSALRKLEALGRVFMWMGDEKDGCALQSTASDLGDIIEDYARALAEAVESRYPAIKNVFTERENSEVKGG